MTPRLDAFAAAPALMQAWLELGRGVTERGGLEDSLMELVKIRASQTTALQVEAGRIAAT